MIETGFMASVYTQVPAARNLRAAVTYTARRVRQMAHDEYMLLKRDIGECVGAQG